MEDPLYTLGIIREHAEWACKSKMVHEILAFYSAARWLLSDLEEHYKDSGGDIVKKITQAKEHINCMLALHSGNGHTTQQHRLLAITALDSIKEAIERH